MPDEVLYDIGSSTEVFYLVMTGKLVIEAEVRIVEVNKYPTSLNKWEVINTERVFEYRAHQINENEMFGLEEVISQLTDTDPSNDDLC